MQALCRPPLSYKLSQLNLCLDGLSVLSISENHCTILKHHSRSPSNFSWCAYWIFTVGCFTVMYLKCRMKWCISDATRCFLIVLSQPKTALLLKSIVLPWTLSLYSYYAGLSETAPARKPSKLDQLPHLSAPGVALREHGDSRESRSMTWRDMTAPSAAAWPLICVLVSAKIG